MLFRQALSTLIAAAVLLLTAFAANAASDTMEGTPAWSTGPLVLHQGPGAAYDVVGQIPDDTRLTVFRCSPLWCVVEAGNQKGWTRSGAISFGVSSADWFTPGLQFPVGGTACLYEGENYTGAYLCLDGGSVYSDLLLHGADNRFSSIKIEAGSFSLCRDRKFQSYCERVLTSQPVLDPFLNNNVSSARGHRQ
jgi:hypothetical protein